MPFFLKKSFVCVLVFLAIALLCGCSSEKVEPKAELKAEPMAAPVATLEAAEAEPAEPTRGLPADTLLFRAFAFYKQFNASNDSILLDSMIVYRNLFFARWRRATDSICAAVPADDSLAADLREINAAVMRYLVQQENRRAESIYYAQLLQVNYKDASSSGRMEKKKSACMKGTPMGQKVIALSEQYETILNKFMNANAQGGLREGFDVKKAFFLPLIEVQQKHRGNGYHFESFPAVVDITFNAGHDKAEVAVRRSFYSGSHYELSKNDGKWEVVRQTSRWMN